jgi:hypothetical protein
MEQMVLARVEDEITSEQLKREYDSRRYLEMTDLAKLRRY